MNFLSLFAHAEPLAVGSPAPTPAAVDQDGKPFDLAAVCASGITLVYFYPKADTPGCTTQACSIRDSIATLTTDGVHVVGVSKDTAEAQRKFQEKYSLPFPLLADTDGTVAKAFAVDLIPVAGITKRQSFLIKDGRIVWVDLAVNPATHVAKVREAVAGLK